MPLRTVVVFAVAMAVAGCGASTNADRESPLRDDSVIVYEFHDSSVPPEFHRSITLTSSRDQSRIVIDSYGEVLADETVPTPASVWTQLAETIDTVSALEVADGDDGCAGGTSVGLTVSSGGDLSIDLDPRFCGGSNEGIERAIDGWIAPIRQLFPPTSELAPEDS